MFGDGSLTFREFAMREPLPLATIHDAVLDFLRGRTDAVLWGTQAINAYVDQPRMTQCVDILSPRAADLAEELRVHLCGRFQIELRTRNEGSGIPYRLEQVRQPKNRLLVIVRNIECLPVHQVIEQVMVAQPMDLICQRVASMTNHPGTPREMMDLSDIYRLLLAFPELKSWKGKVTDRLRESVRRISCWMPGVRLLIRRSRRKTTGPASEGGGAKETPGGRSSVLARLVGVCRSAYNEWRDSTGLTEGALRWCRLT